MRAAGSGAFSPDDALPFLLLLPLCCTDDAWVNGSYNHNSTTQGSWEARKRAALQAYHEARPLRWLLSPLPRPWSLLPRLQPCRKGTRLEQPCGALPFCAHATGSTATPRRQLRRPPPLLRCSGCPPACLAASCAPCHSISTALSSLVRWACISGLAAKLLQGPTPLHGRSLAVQPSTVLHCAALRCAGDLATLMMTETRIAVSLRLQLPENPANTHAVPGSELALAPTRSCPPGCRRAPSSGPPRRRFSSTWAACELWEGAQPGWLARRGAAAPAPTAPRPATGANHQRPPRPLHPGCCRGFAAFPPEAWPKFPQLQQALDAYKAKSEAERLRPDSALLGPRQLQWVRASTYQSLARNTKWQLYGSSTIVQDQ